MYFTAEFSAEQGRSARIPLRPRLGLPTGKAVWYSCGEKGDRFNLAARYPGTENDSQENGGIRSGVT